MRWQSVWAVATWVGLTGIGLNLRGAEDGPVNLLREPFARVERTSPGLDTASVQKLLDEQSASVLRIPEATEPIEIVVGFGDQLVTIENLAAGLPQDAPPVRLQLFASTVAPNAGFALMRSDILEGKDSAHQLAFTASAARWVLLRFSPVTPETEILLPDVQLTGYLGPPVTRYAFKESPAKAFDVLARLKASSSLDLTISADEASLFEDAQDGKLDHWSFAEAALIASGVLDPEKRKSYLEEMDLLESRAREVTSAAKNDFEKGEQLLSWMHSDEGPFANGYVAQQTDVSEILDSGTFNCVSSAALYNILGRRLGLDVRAVEVPDHAFAVLYDGTQHADVETTTALGFNPERDPSAQRAFEQQTGFRYIPDSNRDQRREIGETGLVAIIYYNHGVSLGRDDRHHEALLAYFRAMSLDQEFASAVKNALASLVNWGLKLEKQGEFDSSLNVIGTGLALAPKDSSLLHNRNVVWSRWAQALADEGDDDRALELLRKAAAEVPEGNFLALQSWLYIRRAEAHTKESRWEQALAAVEPGLAKVDEMPRAELIEYRDGLYVRWANAELKKQQFEKAMDVLEQGLVQAPEHSALRNNVAYTLQQWLQSAATREGTAHAKQIFLAQSERFANVPDLVEIGRNHARRVFLQLRDAGKYEEALQAIAEHAELLNGTDDSVQLHRDAFNSWATSLANEGHWQEAVEIYERGLAEMEGDSQLQRNMAYTIQQWTRDALSASGAEEAKAILREQLRRFPEVAEVRQVAEGHVQRLVTEQLTKSEFEAALKVAEQHRDLLEDEHFKRLVRASYDQWASSMRKKEDWEAAVEVYDRALRQLPADSHLTRNAVATWHGWAKPLIDKKDWNGAIAIYERALEKFPNEGTLNNNLKYCQQQLK